MATEAPTAGVMVGGSGVTVRAVTVRATGYGAMQLAGDGAFGPPRDRGEAVAVPRGARFRTAAG